MNKSYNFVLPFLMMLSICSCTTVYPPNSQADLTRDKIEKEEEQRQIDPQLHEAYDLDKSEGSID